MAGDRDSIIYIPGAAQICTADDFAVPPDTNISSSAETTLAATVSVIRNAASRAAAILSTEAET